MRKCEKMLVNIWIPYWASGWNWGVSVMTDIFEIRLVVILSD